MVGPAISGERAKLHGDKALGSMAKRGIGLDFHSALPALFQISHRSATTPTSAHLLQKQARQKVTGNFSRHCTEPGCVNPPSSPFKSPHLVASGVSRIIIPWGIAV
jgi:hypothetical protein